MNAFRALSYRNYRLLFIGQGLSMIGTWMQNIALAWLVYRLTNSVFLLGLVGFLSQIMVFIFAPLAGVIADRFNRQKIALFTQTLCMLQAFILAFLVFSNTISIWKIMFLSAFLGLINSLDLPTGQSLLVQTIDNKKDLGNAIALSSSIFNAARLIGPSIAGIIIAAFGEGFCFLINGISYIAAIISLFSMRFKPIAGKKIESKILKELKEGFVYAFHFIPIRYILILIGLVSLIGMPYVILMPVFARDILHGGPQTLGFLMGAAGVGALLGALYLASKKTVLGLSSLIAISSTTFAAALIILSFTNVFWLAALIIMISGFGMMLQMASCNIILQTIVDEDKRGRVMSLYTMAFMGMTPFGSLLAGSLAYRFGVPTTLLFNGMICLLCAAAFAFMLPQFKKTIRPVYIKIGILPEVNTAIQVVSDLTVVSEKE